MGAGVSAPSTASRRRKVVPLVVATTVVAVLLSAEWFRGGSRAPVGFALGLPSPSGMVQGPPERALVRVIDGRSEVVEGWWLTDSPDVAFDGEHVLFAGRRDGERVPRLREMASDGSGVRDVLACERGCASPRYLADGRIVFSAPVGDDGTEALFTATANGASLDRITFGSGRDRAEGVLEDGRIAFTRAALQDVTGAQAIRFAIQPDGTGLAAREAAPRVADVSRVVQRTTPDAAAPVFGPRTHPPIATSVVNRTQTTGWLLCLDAWLTREGDKPVRVPGSATHVRVLDAQSGAALGDVALETDGSFFVEVPADRALRLAMLDGAGTEVRRVDTEIWVRPNEHRGCIGCHEPPSLAVVNRLPQALRGGAARAVGSILSVRADATATSAR